MTTKEDLNQDEEVEETKPNQGDESEEADELNDLFSNDDSDDDSDDNSDEDKVARLEKKIEDIQKGVNKYFSEKGREKKQEEKEEPIKETSLDDLSELFYAQTPQAELVQDDLVAIAEAKYGGSILKAWRNETWVQDKASSLDSAKKEEEVTKSKISKPSNGTVASNKVDIKKVKPEDVSSLTPSQKVEWLRNEANKERNIVD